MSQSTDDLPYAGLKVFDASQGVAGPHCGMLLALHGADVVKLEPLGGDWGRALGATYGDLSAFGLSYNRGKRSVALDLKNEEGLAIAQRLAAEADVVIESFRPGVMARFGLDHASTVKVNPNVITVSISGFGQSGPYSKQPVTDSIMQAFSGLMSINRDKDGTPQRIGMIAIDVFTGLYAFQAVAPALYRRAFKGTGAHLDVSLMQAALAFQAAKIAEFHLEGAGNAVFGAPLGTFPCSDGFININARRDAHFRSVMKMIGREELIDDPRYSSAEARVANADDLNTLVADFTARGTRDEWMAKLREADILAAKVNEHGDLAEDEHVGAVEAIKWIEQSGVGRVPMPDIPGLAPAVQGHRLAAAPHLGEHTREVLEALGESASEIDRLAAAGAILVGQPGQARAAE